MQTRQRALQHLRSRVGTSVLYRGEPYTVLEILTQEAAVVLHSAAQTVIQANQHGEASRRVPATVTLPIFLSEGGMPNPDLIEVGLLTASWQST